MKVVAVVPAFRNELTIQRAVRALLADDRVDQVIVVDDGSGIRPRILLKRRAPRCSGFRAMKESTAP